MPRGAQVEERPSADQRAGEPDGLDERMLHQCFAHIALAALHKTESARRHAGPLDCGVHGLRDDLARAGMGRMALDHDRAPRRKGAGRVSPGDRKG
jgi:hypothetical protein